MARAGLSAKVWLALAAVYVVWGSTYLAIAYVIESVPPFLGAGARWLLAGAILYAAGARGRDPADRPTSAQWRNAAIIGTALCLGGNGLVSLSERRIPTGMAALLVATVPLFAVAFEFARHRARLARPVIVGLVLGFAGTALLVGSRGNGRVDVVGALLVLSASVFWVTGSLFSRDADLPRRPMVAVGMEMLCGGSALLAAGALGGEFGRFHPGHVSRASLLALGYLIVVGSLVAFQCYAWLLRNVKTPIALSYAYVNPLVAVMLGWAIRHERITATTIAGGTIVVVAVALIVSAGDPTRGAAARSQPDLASQEHPV